MISFVVPKSN